MSDKVINPEELESAVKEILNSYSKEVVEVSRETVKTVANDCKMTIQNNVNKANIKGTGKYRNSWVSELESQNDYETTYRVHSEAPYYRLAHLLEYGHEKWVWGKNTGGRVDAFPHIRPAVRDMKKNFSAILKVGLKKK